MKSLAGHLGDGDPAAWRAALRVLEYACGKPKEELAVDFGTSEDPLDLARLTQEQRRAIIANLARQHPHIVRALLGPAAVPDVDGSGTTDGGDSAQHFP